MGGGCADIFSIDKNMQLCIVGYYSKFSIMKKAEGLPTDDLIGAAKIVFTEFGLPKKIISDAGTISYQTGSNNYADC